MPYRRVCLSVTLVSKGLNIGSREQRNMHIPGNSFLMKKISAKFYQVTALYGQQMQDGVG